MDFLTKAMNNAHLSNEAAEPEQLLFNPQPSLGVPKKALQNIPRYLFRVVSPQSAGETNEEWARSQAALCDGNSPTEDIFFSLDCEKKKEYIYYRHLSPKDGSALEDIRLYVVDTTMFLQGTFMRDLDLIDIFCDYDGDLENLKGLRTTRGYYFGEYLSQGSLKIEGKCQVISGDILFEEDRLRRIQPEFAELRYDIEPEWANAVLRLRGAIWPPEGSTALPWTEIRNRLQAISEIVQTLADDWTIPISIHFAALIGPRAVFPNPRVPEECGPVNWGVEVSDALPELRRVFEIASDINAASSQG